MFHFKDGWFFERNSDGSVRVLKMSDATGQAVKVSEANIDPDAWASIVSFVSAEKNAAVAWSAVREFHMEGILRSPVVHQELTGITPPGVLEEQIERLSQFILGVVPGEPSRDEGAVDCAIRLLKAVYLERVVPSSASREAFTQFVNEALGETSRCWDPKPTGVFDVQAVLAISDRIVDFILGTKLNAEPVPDSVFEAPDAIESPPPGAELEQPVELMPEPPTEGEGTPPKGS